MAGYRLLRILVALGLLAALPVLTARQAEATSCPCNLFGSLTPTLDDSGPDGQVTIATRFYTDVDGYVTGVRFYKSAANTGTHVGKLWADATSNAFPMGQVTFTGESASGWQTATFANPIYVQANRSYMISYDSSVGHYARDDHYFDTLPSSGPLHVNAPGSGFGYGAADPTGSYNNSNYWVDVIFTPYNNITSLSGLTHRTPSAPAYVGSSGGEVGTRFSSDVATRVLGIRYWGNNPWYNPVPVNLWKSDGTLLATGSYGDYNLPTGWIEVYFATPVAISAGQEYVASYQYGGPLGRDAGYFTAPYTNGNLHAPANAGVYSASTGFPTTQTDDNFWVEPIVALETSVPVSVSIDPSFTFSIANRAIACNGESNFVAGAGSASSIGLGHLAAGANVSGGQALTVTGNAGHGFTVYVRGSQAIQNLRGTSHNWTDVAGTYASPAALGSGERFGYTYSDSTSSSSVTNPTPGYFAALTSTNRAVMGSSTAPTGAACISFDAQTSASTPADSYTATVLYTAVPTF